MGEDESTWIVRAVTERCLPFLPSRSLPLEAREIGTIKEWWWSLWRAGGMPGAGPGSRAEHLKKRSQMLLGPRTREEKSDR